MTRVKLCGLCREADIQAANRCLPDFAGFVFAPSKRRVDREQARALRKLLDPRIASVGVFVNEDPEAVALLHREGIIALAQLHGDEEESYRRALRSLAPGCPIIQAVRVGNTLPPLPEGADYLLFDALSAKGRGGVGEAFSWETVRPVERPYFLAGGLHPGNVAAAVRLLNPWCVDVSSGVETDGGKDPRKMEEFVAHARQALHTL